MADGDGLTGGPGSGRCGGSLDFSRADAADEPPPDLLGRIQLTASEGARTRYELPRTVIIWDLGLEYFKYALRAVRGPRGNTPSVSFAQRLWRSHRFLSGRSWCVDLVPTENWSSRSNLAARFHPQHEDAAAADRDGHNVVVSAGGETADVPTGWAAFPVNGDPRPVVLLEEPVRIGGGGFLDGESKQAWLAAAVETDVPLPDGLLDLLRAGRPHQPTGRPLLITTVEATSAEFWCDRGPRRLAAYRLRITGMRQPCTILDPAVDLWWPFRHDEPIQPRLVATVDGTAVHFPAFGGVLTDFHRAEFTEYDTCVVGHPITSQRPARPGTAIQLVLIATAVIGHLDTALGGRVLLTEAGTPVAALPTTQPA
jgi:hypothetical protein